MNARLLALLAAAFAWVALAGCGRTPPTPVSKLKPGGVRESDSQTGASIRRSQSQPPENVRRSIRDDAVQPAAFAVPLPPPKSEPQLAAEALSRIGPPAVPMLVEALRSPERTVRRQACAVLLRMGPDAKEAVPDLVRLLDDEDEEIRKSAAKALGGIGPDAAEAVPALMRTMLQAEPLPPPADAPAPFPPQ